MSFAPDDIMEEITMTPLGGGGSIESTQSADESDNIESDTFIAVVLLIAFTLILVLALRYARPRFSRFIPGPNNGHSLYRPASGVVFQPDG